MMPCMWPRRVGTVRASGETGTVAAVAGTNSECCFLFLMAAGITCRPGQTFPEMYKGTAKTWTTRKTKALDRMIALMTGPAA